MAKATIPTKQTGDVLTAAEVNAIVVAVNLTDIDLLAATAGVTAANDKANAALEAANAAANNTVTVTWADVNNKPEVFVSAPHQHTKSEITDFAHSHLKADITDFAHTHTKIEITDFAHTHPATEITQDSTHRFVTDTEKAAWGASGPGDMLKSVYDPNNDGKVNSAVTADAVPYSGVTGKPATFTPSAHNHTKAEITDFAHTHPQSEITNLTTDLGAKLTGNTAITGATKTKITYDSKGLVTAGADLAAADLPAHTHTKSQITDFAHTHPQTDITNLVTDLGGKQATLVSGTNIKTVGGQTVLGSGDIPFPSGTNYTTKYEVTGDVLSSATANALLDVTGLSFTATAGVTYKFYASLIYTANATTTGSRFVLNGPASPTLLFVKGYHFLVTATTESITIATAYLTPAASSVSSFATNTGNPYIMEGFIRTSASGPVTIQFASEVAGAGNITVKAGSTLEVW